MTGRTLLFYKIIEKIGESDRSATYRAIDLKQDRNTLFLAVKIFRHPLLSNLSRKQFETHLRRVAKSQPAGICRVYGFEETEEGEQFIAMDYLDGASLKQRLQHGPLPLTAVAAFTIRIAQNLANLHSIGIFHHNLKPGNVIVTQKHAVFLTDFGINQLFPVAFDNPGGTVPESLHYLSPEQLLGQPGDARTDVWGIGVLLYEMLSGRRPFVADTGNALANAILKQAPAPIANFTGPAALLRNIFQRTLAKDPHARYADMETLFQDVKLLANTRPQGIAQPVEITFDTCHVPVTPRADNGTVGEPPPCEISAPPPGLPALLVLPLADPNPPAGEQHFHRGFLIELTRTLARETDIYVTPVAAVLALDNQQRSPREIARQFGVQHVLQGKLSRQTTEITVMFRLIDLTCAKIKWEKTYTVSQRAWVRALEALPHQVAAEVLGQLRAGSPANITAPKNTAANAPVKPETVRPGPQVEPETAHPEPEAAPETVSPEPEAEPKTAFSGPEAAPETVHFETEAEPETARLEPEAESEAVSAVSKMERQSRAESGNSPAAIHHEPAPRAGGLPPFEDIPRKNDVQAPPVLDVASPPPPPGDDVSARSAAQRAYRQGLTYLNQWTVEDLHQARKLFQTAVEKDPGFAPAYAGLSRVYNTLGIYGAYAPKAVMPRALQNAYFALEKDPVLPEALICLGTSLAAFEWDWANARLCLERGLQLNTEDANAYLWYAMNDLLPHGLFERALQAFSDALELDPENVIIQATLGQGYFYARHYTAAIAHNQRLLEKQPAAPIFNFNLARAYWQLAEHQQALDHFHIALRAFSDNMNVLANFAGAAAQIGREDIAKKVLQQLLSHARRQYVSSYDIALVCIGLNDLATAIKWLGKALEERAHAAIYLAVDPLLDPLRDHPRFPELLARLKLEP